MTKPKDLFPADINAKVFWSHVRRGDGCWEWVGRKDRGGYGLAQAGSRRVRAHRAAWALANNLNPGPLLVCHACDNPPCVNPNHLWLGTFDENMADMVAKGRARTGGALAVARRRAPRGEDHGRAILTEEQVKEIRASHLSISKAAEAFGIGQSTVANIRQRKSWKHVA